MGKIAILLTIAHLVIITEWLNFQAQMIFFVNPYMHNFNVAKFLWFFLIARVTLVLIFIEI